MPTSAPPQPLFLPGMEAKHVDEADEGAGQPRGLLTASGHLSAPLRGRVYTVHSTNREKYKKNKK